MSRFEIEVLSTFSTKGVPQPFRLRLQAEDESLVVVNIDRIMFAEENKREETVKYRCECIMQDRKKCVDIYFYKNTMKWYLDLK